MVNAVRAVAVPAEAPAQRRVADQLGEIVRERVAVAHGLHVGKVGELAAHVARANTGEWRSECSRSAAANNACRATPSPSGSANARVAEPLIVRRCVVDLEHGGEQFRRGDPREGGRDEHRQLCFVDVDVDHAPHERADHFVGHRTARIPRRTDARAEHERER